MQLDATLNRNIEVIFCADVCMIFFFFLQRERILLIIYTVLSKRPSFCEGLDDVF